jgi:hypothetical protein
VLECPGRWFERPNQKNKKTFSSLAADSRREGCLAKRTLVGTQG